jgi:TetR/AcrR family transcriptional repressor of nem operon
MRVTREKAAENRANVVATAARLFREKGFDGVGLDAIMAEAGLTHGGFYRHFGSKEGLAAEAVAHAGAVGEQRLADAATRAEFVARYLSPQHRDDVGGGCMLAALGGEIARQGAGPRQGLTAHVRTQIERLAGWLTGRSTPARRQQAIATLAGIVGALVLSRAVDDAELSEEILAAGRAVYGGRAA